MAEVAGPSAADVKDYLASIEKLRTEVAEAALINGLGTDKTKREAFARLNQHYNRFADELERAMYSGPAK